MENASLDITLFEGLPVVELSEDELEQITGASTPALSVAASISAVGVSAYLLVKASAEAVDQVHEWWTRHTPDQKIISD